LWVGLSGCVECGEICLVLYCCDDLDVDLRDSKDGDVKGGKRLFIKAIEEIATTTTSCGSISLVFVMWDELLD